MTGGAGCRAGSGGRDELDVAAFDYVDVGEPFPISDIVARVITVFVRPWSLPESRLPR